MYVWAHAYIYIYIYREERNRSDFLSIYAHSRSFLSFTLSLFLRLYRGKNGEREELLAALSCFLRDWPLWELCVPLDAIGSRLLRGDIFSLLPSYIGGGRDVGVIDFFLLAVLRTREKGEEGWIGFAGKT